MTKNIFDSTEFNTYYNEEIDLNDIGSTLVRNKKFISIFTFISVILSIIYCLTTRKIWEGEFQIVLDDQSESSALSLNRPKGLPIFGNEDPLETQVGILKSPLVLSKVFEFVKKEKSVKNYKNSNLKFKDWKKNSLNIDLEKGTSILNISYRDKEKSLILPALRRISSSYQDYSGRARSREIELSKNFFKEQIDIFRKRSINSLRKAQIFATEQDIAILNGDANIDNEIPNTINIELIRVQSANEIRNIDLQLSQINELNDPESIIYIGRSIPELVAQGLPQKLEMLEEKLINLQTLREEIEGLKEDPEKIQYFGDYIPQIKATNLPNRIKAIETDLAFRKLVYKDDDEIITNLKKNREILIRIFKNQALGYLEADIIQTRKTRPQLISLLKNKSRSFLEARKTVAEATLKAAERPEGVLIEYRQLIGDAKKDKQTLDSLENEYRGILLEEAKIKDPWELITSPNLLSEPVYPKKSRIVLAALLGSFLTSSLLAIYFERKKNIIFSINDLRAIVDWRTLSEISLDDQELLRKSVIYILESDLNYETNNIEILLVGDFEDKLISNLKEIANEIKLNKFKVLNNIFKLSNSSEVITITGLGITKKDQCIEAAQKLQIKKKKVCGTIILKDFNYPNETVDTVELAINNSVSLLNNLKSELKHIYAKYTMQYFKNKIKYYSKLLKKNF